MRLILLLPLLLSALSPAFSQSAPPGQTLGPLLYSEDFTHPLTRWTPELESGGSITSGSGQLNIDVPAGATLWFKPLLQGPILIQYTATVVTAGGANDRLSDLNCFWMARDSRSPADIFATKRSGKFADYNQLLTYYVGLGGNGNTTTRFRRYIGDATLRPLLPEDDLHAASDFLLANTPQTLQLVANGPIIQFYRDGKKLFEMDDPAPYTSGWFAFRTTHSHLVIKSFRIYRLSNSDTPPPR